jgi:exo-1,4-beta-D-glucosaminidase
MKILIAFFLLTVPILASCADGSRRTTAVDLQSTLELKQPWTLASAADVAFPGVEISSPGFDDSTWMSATVPTTVLAAKVASGEIEDPYFGRNLEAIATEPFAGPWWYRTEFQLHPKAGSTVRLVLEGVNYSADVWVNGRQVGSHETLIGAFRQFEIDITSAIVAGKNVLAIEVYPPQPGDPTIGFVDWNPVPPDRNMGLWRPVKLRVTGEIAVDEIFVRTDLDTETLDRASLTISANVTNFSDQARQTTVTARIDDSLEIHRVVDLAPGQESQIVFTPDDFPDLVLENPRLWWPNNMGEPNLYTIELIATTNNHFSDVRHETFGIRQIEDYLNEQGHRGYIVNGKKTLIRGGGWVDDLMLVESSQKVEDQLRYVQHMNLNTIRLEGFWGSGRDLFHLADKYGILVMVGWSCQWEWENYLGGPVDEFGGIDTPEEIDLVSASLRDQVIWLRNHPSVFLWVLGSDMLPRPALEQRYLEVLDEVDTTRPALAACAVATSEVSGPTGVKMNGPYDYVPPSYWYIDSENGGAYGFNTETGPGPQPPPAASIRRMMPQENWWPVDAMWEYHSGRNEFNTIDRYKEALDRRYGETTDLEDFSRKAQIANYEAMRAMFEAFSARRPVTTGIIQWMLNSAWPELYWQLYDYYLVPNGAFYATRNANRPLNVVFDYRDRNVIVVNDTAEDLPGHQIRVRVLSLQAETLYEENMQRDLPAESRESIVALPEVAPDSGVYFVDLRLLDPTGTVLASNLYWLSTEMDTLDWEATEWFYTPIARFADFSALAAMPTIDLDVQHRFAELSDGAGVSVTLTNPSDQIAFFIELQILGSDSGELLAPVLWDDNYFSLLPGESREVTGSVPRHALGSESPVLHYSGWNVPGS